MRNILVISSNGIIYSSEYKHVVNPNDKKFKRHFFKTNGKIITIQLLDTIKTYYANRYQNSVVIDELLNLEDPYNIHLIYNSYASDNISPNAWDVNDFLTGLFGFEIAAEGNCVLCADVEFEQNSEITHVEYSMFMDSIVNMLNIINSVGSKEYLLDLNISITNDDCILLDNDDVISFQDEYLGTKRNSTFTESLYVSDTECIVRKPGVLLYQTGNSGILFFGPVNVNNIGEFKEIIN